MEEVEAETAKVWKFIIDREIEAPERFRSIQSYRCARGSCARGFRAFTPTTGSMMAHGEPEQSCRTTWLASTAVRRFLE